MNRVRVTLALFVSTLTTASYAQTVPDAAIPQALHAWRAQHGANWRVDLDQGTGYAKFLFGGSAPASAQPVDEADWFTLARNDLALAQPIHGIEAATLIEHATLFLPLGTIDSSDKMTVRFRQVVNGVPVEGGWVNVLFDTHGTLLSIQTRALPAVAEFDVHARINADDAARLALGHFKSDTGLPGSVAAEPELVIAQIERAEQRVPVLVWKVDAQWLPADTEPEGYLYYLDATSGEVVQRLSSIHHFDVGGTVFTKATAGLAPDVLSNPETQQVMKYARVQSSAGTVFSDANGAFNFPGATGPLNCTFTYVGTYNNVANSAGAPYSLVQPLTGTGNTVLLNPTDVEQVTAQANAFVGVNLIRDWVRSINPLDATADFVHTANVNIASTCNAFFSTNSINFYLAGGGCPNTAYSTVIAHEDGHWLNVNYGTGNGPDGMGEGNADVFAEYIHDTNIVAQDFFGPGQPIRDGLNTKQFCGDCCPGCFGEVHTDGEVWMGAAWKIRRNLNTSLGNGPGDAVANTIFMGWMNGYNQTEIKSVIETQWLTLDDNDGNINNGTPHFFDIDNGFREQGFPGVAFDPIVFANVTELDDTTNTAGPYTVQATVISNIGGSIASANVWYRVGWSGSYAALPMTPSGGNVYTAGIPGQAAQSKVFYYIEATDNVANVRRFPATGANDPIFFGIGNVQSLMCDSFEISGSWTTSVGGFNAGDWERGDPLGTLNAGVQAQPEFDNSPGAGVSCYFTDQGSVGGNSNEADVDGGPHTLTSPVVPIAFDNGEVRYSYWMYNDDGDDSLLVQLSNNGTTWVTARSHTGGAGGWKSAKVDVKSFISPNPQIYVRFSVTDSPNNSCTEAAIDDVCVTTLAPAGCAQPVVFCATKIDSSFCAPQISYAGLGQVSGNQPLTIALSNASALRNGLLFYGYGSQVIPYQGGALCCVSPLRRTPIHNTGGTTGCTGTLTYDFNALIRSGTDANLNAGTDIATQYYYRDPLDSFHTALSNGVKFTICP